MTKVRRQAIAPRWLVPARPEGQVLEDHAVVIADDRIEAVIPRSELPDGYPGIEVVELPRHALIPGLVNTHTHSAMALMRGLADDLPLMEWLEEHVWPAEQQWVAPDYVRAGAELAIAEMLAGGITCFNDQYFFPEVIAGVAQRAGMRAVVGVPIINVSTAWARSEDECFSRGLEFHQEMLSESLVSTAFAPHAPYTVTDAAFERMRDLAEEMDVPIHLHLLETAGELQMSLDQYGKKPLERMEALGLLGPRLIAVHMTQVGGEDIDRIARAGVNVAHCPSSNLKLASGICPLAELDAAGVNVAIGTDGAASNNTLDMFAETRLAALLAKGASGNTEAIPAARALSMATWHGARALGLDERIGWIEAGMAADLAAVEIDRIETQPVHSVISHLVYAVGRHQVSDVWVAGQRVVEGHRHVTLDIEQISTRAATWKEKLGAQAATVIPE